MPPITFRNGSGDFVEASSANPMPVTGASGGAMTVANGADVAEGATTDAVVAAGAAGTLSAKLRRLTTDLGALLAQLPATLGGKTAAASLAVTTATDDPLVTRLGEVQASPTSNTVLDRLKALLTGIVLAAGENHVGSFGGQILPVYATELTRPTPDVTAYTAKDAVSDSASAPTVITFTNLARVNAGQGYIVKARLMTDQKTCVARFRLHLFDTAPTAINDNSPYTLLYANRLIRLGYIDFPPCSTEDATNSTGAQAQNDTIRLAFACVGGSRTIYGLLETLDAFTPAAAQKFTVALDAEAY